MEGVSVGSIDGGIVLLRKNELIFGGSRWEVVLILSHKPADIFFAYRHLSPAMLSLSISRLLNR